MLLRILPSPKGQLCAALLKILRPPVGSLVAFVVVVLVVAAAAAAAADAAVAAPAVVTSLLAPLTFSSAWQLQHRLLRTAPAAVKEVSSKRPAGWSSGWANQTT